MFAFPMNGFKSERTNLQLNFLKFFTDSNKTNDPESIN